jgi:hypothetical protein
MQSFQKAGTNEAIGLYKFENQSFSYKHEQQVWLVRCHLQLNKACFPLGEFVRANREKGKLDWLATNTDDITNQSHSLLACSCEKNRQVENRLMFDCRLLGFVPVCAVQAKFNKFLS